MILCIQVQNLKKSEYSRVSIIRTNWDQLYYLDTFEFLYNKLTAGAVPADLTDRGLDDV